MDRFVFGRKLERLFVLLEPVFPAQDLDDVTGFWGQAEWDLALDLAARLIVERGYPIRREIYELCAELLPETEWAGQHDLAAMERQVVPDPVPPPRRPWWRWFRGDSRR